MSKGKKQTRSEKSPASARVDQQAADHMAAELAAAQAAESGQQDAQARQDELQSLRAELEKAKDQALRSQAELENYRKRVARDLEAERRYAHFPLVRDLLPVLDDMDRAIEAAEQTHDVESLLQGVKMVAQQLHTILKRFDCVKMEPLGEPFDPHRHEAISQQPCEDHPAGTVLQVTRAGYQLHDRVVRPAQVIVASENQAGKREASHDAKPTCPSEASHDDNPVRPPDNSPSHDE